MERFAVVFGDYIKRLDAVVSNLKPHYFSGIQLEFIIAFRNLLASALKYADGEIAGVAGVLATPASLKSANGQVGARMDAKLSSSSERFDAYQLKAESEANLSPVLFRWSEGHVGATICESVSSALQRATDAALSAEVDMTVSPAMYIKVQTEAIDKIVSVAMRGAILKAAAEHVEYAIDVSKAAGIASKSSALLIESVMNVTDGNAGTNKFGDALLGLVETEAVSGDKRSHAAIKPMFHMLFALKSICARAANTDPVFTTMESVVAETLVAFRRVYELDDLVLTEIDDMTIAKLDYTER